MSYGIADIEDAILSTLQASAMGGYCRKFDSWSAGLERAIENQSLTIPACYAIYLSGAYDDLTGGGQDKVGRFGIAVFASNLRGQQAARRGGPGAAEVGAYQMIDDARIALHNSDLGLSILACRVTREGPLDLGQTYAAYLVEIDVEWRFD